MLKLIVQSLNKRRVQSAATMLAVAVSVAVLLALFLVYRGVTAGIETSRQRLGADILVIPASAQTLYADADLLFTGAPAVIYMSEDYAGQVARIDGVTAVTAQFFGQTLNQNCCSSTAEVRLIGFDAGSDWLIQPWADQVIGRKLAANEVILGGKVEGFAEDEPEILGHRVQVAARLNPTGTDLDHSVIMDIDTVRAFSKDLQGYDHFWQKYGEPENLISALMVQVDEAQAAAVAAEISGLGNVKIIQSSNVLRAIQKQMNVVFILMLGCGVLLVLASVLQLFARFFSMAWDRRSELGLYRALGATRRDLRTLIIGEAGILTGSGIACGLLCGGGLYAGLLALLQQQSAFPYIAPGVLTVLAGIAGLIVLFGLISVMAVSVPLRYIAKVDPAVAMQRSDID